MEDKAVVPGKVMVSVLTNFEEDNVGARSQYSSTSQCKKCSCGSAHAEYQRIYDADGTKDEYILRTCVNCGFKWRERPLGARAKEAQ